MALIHGVVLALLEQGTFYIWPGGLSPISMSSERVEFVFLCPECGESLEVNDSMKEALVEKGCVVCGASVTAEAFTPEQSSESS